MYKTLEQLFGILLNNGPSQSGMPQPFTSEQWNAVYVLETTRSEEYIGVERRIVDNLRSSSTLHRSLTLNREWIQTYVVEKENTRTTGGSINFGANQIAGFDLTVENVVASKYSTTRQTRRLYAEEINIDVSGGKRMLIDLHWKRIWQHGFVRLRNKQNIELEIPFRVTIGLTFDQVQVDQP